MKFKVLYAAAVPTGLSALFISVLILANTAARAENTQAVRAVLEGALAQVGKTLSYNPSYRKLDYPGGDVPLETGVCTDVVIRALRKADVDLQVLVHKDMGAAFKHYPNNWGLKKPDRNIDHRRVLNLRVFFERFGKALPVTLNSKNYQPADIVTWVLPNGLPHIGIVSKNLNNDAQHPLIIHNIGAGAREEDILFEFKITGHYRFFTEKTQHGNGISG